MVKKDTKSKENRRNRKDGRYLETFVKQIEQLTLPAGITITSNHRVVDEEGDQVAEFDIYIKGRIGTVDLHWLIECRDRPSTGSAPRSWIEQLMGRRQASHLSKVIAVSTTDFSPPAVKLARSNDIEIRTLEDVTAEDVKSWLSKFKLVVINNHFRVKKIYLQPAPNSSPEAVQAMFRILRRKKPQDKCIRYQGKGSGNVSFSEVFLRFSQPSPQAIWGNIADGVTREKTLPFVFNVFEEAFFIDTALGSVRLLAAICTAELSVEVKETAMNDIKRYRRGKVLIAHGATASYRRDDGSEIVFDVVNVTETGSTYAYARPDESEKSQQRPPW